MIELVFEVKRKSIIAIRKYRLSVKERHCFHSGLEREHFVQIFKNSTFIAHHRVQGLYVGSPSLIINLANASY